VNTFATEVLCPICRTPYIVAEVAIKEIEFTPSTMIGPLKANPEIEVKNFHCPYCMVLFLYPPGMPNAKQVVLETIYRNRRGGKKL